MPGILQQLIPDSEEEETLKPCETSLSTLLCLASSSQQLLGLFFISVLLHPAIKNLNNRLCGVEKLCLL